MFWRRHRSACLLALVACAVELAATVLQPFVLHLVIRAAWRHGSPGVALGVVTLVFSVIYAGVFGLLLAAAFVGRRPAAALPPPFQPLPSH